MHTVPATPPTAARRHLHRNLRSAGATALAALVLLAGCAGDGSTAGTGAPPGADPAPTVPATVEPTTSAPATTVDPGPVEAPPTELLDQLLETRDEAGRMPVGSALTAFAAVYGDLPGVEPSALEPEGIEGTTAARWLAAHRAELTEEQRAAVDAAMAPLDIDGTPLDIDGTSLAPPASGSFRTATGLLAGPSRPDAAIRPAVAPREPETGCFGGSFPFADAPGAGKYGNLVRLALAEVAMLMGPLDIPVYTAFSQFEGVNADLNPWSEDCDGPAQACQIRIAPLGLQMTDSTLMKTLAHELVHCYQARAVGATATAAMPDWLIEGFPSYIGETVGVSVGATTPNYWWDRWFKSPGTQLYGRTYDALGFYAVLQQAGGDPARSFITALKTKDSSAAFQSLIGPVADHFGTIWGATHFRQIQRGLFWDLDHAGATLYKPALPVSIVTDGGGYQSALSEAQAEADRFDLRAAVVVVRLDGAAKGRYSFAGGADEVISEELAWCTLGYPCVCPEDSERSGVVVEQAPASELAVGAAGIAAGGTLSVTGLTFDDYCGPKRPKPTDPPVPPAVDPCLIGSWVSDTFTIPGPPGLDLSLTGGAGISMMIDREGGVTVDFSGMARMTGTYSVGQSGTATQEIVATGGDVQSARLIEQDMKIGPGVFALWRDVNTYRCAEASFTMESWDDVESLFVPITFRRAG